MKILAFESSCDETSVAVLENDTVLSNVVLSQLFHSEWGGVIPETASREHLKNIVQVTEEALQSANIDLKQIELIAATNEPGLIGALLVGLSYAKAIAITLNLPFVPVNHIQAHLYSAFLMDEKPEFPFISLIVSGGHTLLILVEDFFKHKVIGTTVDDAAGEAFDKGAKLLGLGYPGGPMIDKLAQTGDENFHKFPLAYVKDSPYNFSFSGIKTSLLYYLRQSFPDGFENICASYQKAIIDSLFQKTLLAAKKYNIKKISISGGVSANTGLKEKFFSLEEKGYKIYVPSLKYSTDNAAMIGITAYYKYINSKDKKYFNSESFNVSASARIKLDEL